LISVLRADLRLVLPRRIQIIGALPAHAEHMTQPINNSSNVSMTSKADLIAEVVLRQFDKLPNNRKPVIRDNGAHEWVPLSGIVAEQDGVLKCLSLA
jgi:hypothetical protein